MEKLNFGNHLSTMTKTYTIRAVFHHDASFFIY
jgi:hypothetical protein